MWIPPFSSNFNTNGKGKSFLENELRASIDLWAASFPFSKENPTILIGKVKKVLTNISFLLKL
jgi:hypothetical protein